jgi:hypothetical protein
MKANIAKQLIQASYEKNAPPRIKNGWRLDDDLSKSEAKVYRNKNTNEAIIVHRGTQGLADWKNNLAYLTGNYKRTERFKTGQRIQRAAEAKYGKENITTMGHSQGGVLARELGKNTKQIINVNPAYMLEKPAKNEYTIRSSGDIVSGLETVGSVLYPKLSRQQNLTIAAPKRSTILGEHSSDILDRLGKQEIGK